MRENTMRRKTLTLTIALVALGFATSVFAAGLEEVRSRFNEVQSAYDDTQEYVNAGNTDSGKSAAEALLSELSDMCPYVQDIKDKIAEIPALQPVWKDVAYWCLEFTVRTKTMKDYLGQGDPKENLSKVTEGFLKLGDSLKAAYDQFNAFGKNWTSICDSCR
jgi:hypothetical protein